ncbi:glutaredoxin 3 [Catenovulum maritimum]|uniref:Glutaredoxin n=1 Tax=Catenovulum maritimum TaxID=1513271 RepID=A0A0J8GNZ9_9ALTE|nr:glutaredoxin 3 [Catenovulum maritimum]KMT64530.1 glutaredoxin [Catenovulum maritimum]
MANVIIYTKAWCPFCVRAKSLLSHKGVEFTELKIDSDAQLRQEMINKSNGSYTVPQIFINEQHVGGCDDLYAAEANGTLDRLLK